MILVDVHAHMDHVAFRDDIELVIKRAEEAGVRAIITNGINPETNRISLDLAERFRIVRPALGIYPIDALRKEAEEFDYPIMPVSFDVDEEIRFIESQRDRIAAIGEIGLEFRNSEDRVEQVELFKKMLGLASRIDKPVIVHSRDAEREVVEILIQAEQKKVVLHCFSGSMKLVKRGIDNGWFFSIPANVVRSQHFQNMIKLSPVSRLLTETDAPLLSPFRDKRNEPAFVSESLKKIAEIKDLDLVEAGNIIYQNYLGIFGSH